MERLKPVANLFNSLTGRAERHNRALRDVLDWSTTIHDFLSKYDAEKSHNLDLILEHIGEAKFDLTNITYKARGMIPTTKNIRGKKMRALVEEIVGNLEELRIMLIRPDMNMSRLEPMLAKVCELFNNLQGAILETEYM